MKSIFNVFIGAIFFLNTTTTVGQPVIIVDGPLEFCSDESVNLCVSPTYSTYLWNTGATTNCISVTESGEYYAFVLDENSNIDSSLFFNPTSVIVHNPQPMLSERGDTIIVTNEFEAYQWFHNGDSIPDATNPAYRIIMSGNYYVQVTDAFGCTGRSYTFEFVPEGVGETGFGLMDVFPNPTSDKIRIDFGESIKQVSLKVFSPLGRLIHTQQLNGIRYFDHELPETNGIYLIQLLSADGKKRTLKVVKE